MGAHGIDDVIDNVPGSTLDTPDAVAAADLFAGWMSAGYFNSDATPSSRDDRAHLLARALQLFVPGIPQVYYVGLLAGANDMGLLARTGVGRDVNRHRYSPEEIGREMTRPVVRAQLWLLRLRAGHPAFQGGFSSRLGDGRALLSWRNGDQEAVLEADVRAGSFSLGVTLDGGRRTFDDEDLMGAGAAR
jgi:sucrose phosphorylase